MREQKELDMRQGLQFLELKGTVDENKPKKSTECQEVQALLLRRYMPY